MSIQKKHSQSKQHLRNIRTLFLQFPRPTNFYYWLDLSPTIIECRFLFATIGKNYKSLKGKYYFEAPLLTLDPSNPTATNRSPKYKAIICYEPLYKELFVCDNLQNPSDDVLALRFNRRHVVKRAAEYLEKRKQQEIPEYNRVYESWIKAPALAMIQETIATHFKKWNQLQINDDKPGPNRAFFMDGERGVLWVGICERGYEFGKIETSE